MRFEHEGDGDLGPLDAYSPLDTVDDYLKALDKLEADIKSLVVNDRHKVKAVREDLKHMADALQKNREFPTTERLTPGDWRDVNLKLKRLRKFFQEKMKEIEKREE